MDLRTPAIVCAARAHGETGVILRVLSEDHGLVASYVAGGRGRTLRPVLLPGNLVEAELRARPGSQLPSARVELVASRGPWLTEPLPAAAITPVPVMSPALLGAVTLTVMSGVVMPSIILKPKPHDGPASS